MNVIVIRFEGKSVDDDFYITEYFQHDSRLQMRIPNRGEAVVIKGIRYGVSQVNFNFDLKKVDIMVREI